DVVKVEQAIGSPTRRIGPFLDDDSSDPEKSLFFWHHNRGKRSVVCDLDTDEGRTQLDALIGSADIFLDTSCGSLEAHRDLKRESLLNRYPALVLARMTPFGDTGPWAAWK